MHEIGDQNFVVSKYLTRMQTGGEGQKRLVGGKGGRQQKAAYFTGVSILNHERNVSSKLEVTRPFYVCLNYAIARKVAVVDWVVRIDTYDGISVFGGAHRVPTTAIVPPEGISRAPTT